MIKRILRADYSGWLSRLVRYWLFGEIKYPELVKKNDEAYQLQYSSRYSHGSWVRCNFYSVPDSSLYRVVYPITDTKGKNTDKKEKEILIRRGRCNNPDCTDACNCVPRMVDFKAGERITHIFIPNEEGSGDGAQPRR